MAGPAPSSEVPARRTARIAVGVAGALLLIQLFPWPLSYLMPVVVQILLLDAGPMSFRTGWKVIGSAVLCVVVGFLLALVLSPYLGITILVFCLLLFRLYLFMLCSGAHLVVVVGMLIGTVLMPLVTLLLPELGYIAMAFIVLDLIVAFAVARIAFLLILPPSESLEPHHEIMSADDAIPVALSMVVVVAPLLSAFLMFGWTDILVLIYGTLIATAMSTAGGVSMGLTFVRANLIYGGLGMLIVYEILVMAPFLPLMVVLLFTACFIFGSRIFSQGPAAETWSSGFTGFLLLLGAALASDGVVSSSAKVIDRVSQLVMATLYVAFAYAVVDLIRSFVRRDRRAPEPAEG